MFTKLVLLFGAMVLFAGRTNAQSTQTKDELAVRALMTRAIEAENTCNKELWLSTIAEDGAYIGANGPVLKAKLAETFHSTFCNPQVKETVTVDSVEISGNLAVMWGKIDVITPTQADRPIREERGTHIDIARRMPNGQWQFTWWMVTLQPVKD